MSAPKAPKSKKQKERVRDFHAALFRFYKKQGRMLPWRPPALFVRRDGSCEPYHILVSEFMLQQTQVNRVLQKYDEFIKKFPTLKALACASLGDVLTVWSGLGYNRRAKHLHQAAQIIMKMHGGNIPRERGALEKLPGIGHSTASGILAFAYNLSEPMIDTNIRRILERVFFSDTPQRDADLLAFAQTLIPQDKGRIWNYALLDIGASVCGARTHDDARCPFQKLHGAVTMQSRKKPQKRFKESDRWYRGMILKALTVKKQETLSALQKDVTLHDARFRRIVKGLLREGLVVRKQKSLRLP